MNQYGSGAQFPSSVPLEENKTAGIDLLKLRF
jgi:hypothetical protein